MRRVKDNISVFENSTKRLTELGNKRRAGGDVVGAVSAYRNALESSPFDYEANAGLAELYTSVSDAYDTTDLLPEAINCWFRALSVAESDYEKARAYNGLGANYFFLSKDIFAIHYFNEQLRVDPDNFYEYNDVIEDVQDAALDREYEAATSHFGYTLAYDKNSDEDGEKALAQARTLTESGKLNEALLLLTQIKEDSPHFLKALQGIAFILLLQEKFDTAVEISEHILYLDADNFRAQYVLCSAYKNLGKQKESDELFEKLCRRKANDREFNFQMLMLALETERESGALLFADRIVNETPYDLNVLYVRGLIKYNLGDVDGCIADLKKVLIFTDNPVVKNKLAEAREKKENSQPLGKMSYDFNLEEEEVKFRIEELNRRFQDMQSAGIISFDDIVEHCDCIIKCRFTDLLPIGIHMGLALNAKKMHEYLRVVLLDSTVADELKRCILKEYLSLGINMPIRCVAGHIYKSFNVQPVKLSGYAAEAFQEAYAVAASNLYLIDQHKIILLRRRIVKYREKYEQNLGPEDVKPDILAAGIFKMLALPILSEDKVVCEMFSVKQEDLENIIQYLK